MNKSFYKTIKRKGQITTTEFLREGQSIEEIMRINTANKVQPVAMLPEMYQERGDGIDPITDIRTDKFEMALDAMDKVTRAHLLASQNKDKLGKERDNSWITDEDGKPIYDNPTQTQE